MRYFALLLTMALSACFSTKEIVDIRDNGSLRYTITQEINKDALNDLGVLDPNFSLDTALILTDRTMDLVVREVRKMPGVEYAGWTGDLSAYGNSETIKSRFELVLDSFTRFPTVIKNIENIKISDSDAQLAINQLDVPVGAKTMMTSMPAGIGGLFDYKVIEKNGGEYALSITTEGLGGDTPPPPMGFDMPHASVTISTPDMVYTNLDKVGSNRAEATLDVLQASTVAFNGVVEFQMGYLARARIKSLQLLDDLTTQ
ncbi:MAG: hypothetical protein CR958_00090 [Rhodobacterales bacterium]|nr:MAG: hypothetical protein CR958_00090 [Rhodobacterales bacterium]